MKLKKLGKNISNIEILNISMHGVWVYVDGQEYFLPYEDFPWFKKATIQQIQNVRILNGYHLYWPLLDVDLELDSLADCEHYPLIYK